MRLDRTDARAIAADATDSALAGIDRIACVYLRRDEQYERVAEDIQSGFERVLAAVELEL